MKWESVKSFSPCVPACLFLCDEQTSLSHPYRQIVSWAEIESRDDSTAFATWTITLSSGLAVHLFQFEWLVDSCLPKQQAPLMYSEHWPQVEDWTALSTSAGSSCCGLNANTFTAGPRPRQQVNHPSTMCVCPSCYGCVLISSLSTCFDFLHLRINADLGILRPTGHNT